MSTQPNFASHQALLLPALFVGGFLTSAAMLPALKGMSVVENTGASNIFSSVSESANGLATWASENPIYLLAAGAALLVMTVLFVALRPAGTRSRTGIYVPNGITDEAYREAIEEVSVKADEELTDIIEMLNGFSTSNERYADLLMKTDKALPKIKDPKQFQQIIRALIIENKKSHQETVDLQKNLEQSKTQIEELHNDLNEAQREGLRDPLTLLGNRRLFDKTLTQEIETSEKTNRKLSLVMTDIDHFKKFNDDYGHQIGDEVLKMFAQLMQQNTKGKDTVARYGGEEFAIVLPDTDGESAKVLVEQIRAKLENKKLKNNKNGKQIAKVTASFGIAELAGGEMREDLVERADTNLYAAKRQGRNCVVL